MTARQQTALLRLQLAIAELEAAERAFQCELEADERPALHVIAGGQAEPRPAAPPVRASAGS